MANIERGTNKELLEGILHCTHEMCRQEFPVIDGIPIVVPDVGQLSTQGSVATANRGQGGRGRGGGGGGAEGVAGL